MNTFPNNLFDFDFEIENETAKSGILEIITPAKPCFLREAIEVSELPEVIISTLERLHKMAENALDSERMDVYFRILEEIERYEAAAQDAEIDEDSFNLCSPCMYDIA